MTYLISYDIPSSKAGDKRRSRLAKRLEAYGLRVQYSLFEAELPPERLPALLAELTELIDEAEDSLRVYPMCAACSKRAARIGIEAPCEHGPLLIW